MCNTIRCPQYICGLTKSRVDHPKLKASILLDYEFLFEKNAAAAGSSNRSVVRNLLFIFTQASSKRKCKAKTADQIIVRLESNETLFNSLNTNQTLAQWRLFLEAPKPPQSSQIARHLLTYRRLSSLQHNRSQNHLIFFRQKIFNILLAFIVPT